MSIQVSYAEGKFSLAISTLPINEFLYLEKYLDRASRYKVIGFQERHPVISLFQPPLSSPVGWRALQHRLLRRFHGLRIPATATIAVNKTCQCQCTHCSAVYYNHSSKKEMNTLTLQEAIRQTVTLGVTNIILLGGEPLLRKDLNYLIASVPADLAIVTFFTNGEFLTLERCLQLKKAGLLGAFVSLDSAVPKEHDGWRKRVGLYSKALQGIENLKEAGLIAAVSSHLSAQNLPKGHFEMMMELGHEIGADEVTFFDAIPSGSWLHDTKACLTPEDRVQIRELVTAYRAKKNYPGLSVQSTMTSVEGSAFCFAANTQFYLTAFGDMCPCDFTPLTIGRFPEHSIHDLWEKMIETEPYNCRAKSCRMQDEQFRAKYISPLPPKGPFPYPLQKINVP